MKDGICKKTIDSTLKAGIPKKTDAKNKVDIVIAIDKKSFREDADGLHFHGELSGPRVSLNGWIYFPEELSNQNGKTVPLTIMHEEVFVDNPPPRGTMTVFFNQNTWCLDYQAVATEQEAIDGIKSGKYQHVSMTATWKDSDRIRGIEIPNGTDIVAGSLVDSPGIPEASVIVDSVVMVKNDGTAEQLTPCSSEYCDFLQRYKGIPAKKTDSVTETKPDEETKEFVAANTETLEVQSITVSQEEVKTQLESAEIPLEKPIEEKTTVESSLEHQEATSSSMTEKDLTQTDSTKPESKPEPEVKTDNEKKPETSQKIEVKVDNSDVIKEIVELRNVFSDFSKKTNGPGSDKQGAVATDKVDPQAARAKFYDHVTESLRKFQFVDWSYIKTAMEKEGLGLDAIGVTELGGSAGAQWLENITILPSGVRANLRDTCEVVEIQRGAKECHFTLISTPTPVDGTDDNEAPNVPDDVTQSITDIVATPAERLLKQRLTDKAARSTNINLGNAIATTFRNAEGLDEDDKILTELNGLDTDDTAGWVIAGGHADEVSITSTDIMTADLIAQAREAILNAGWAEAEMAGQLVCVMSPTQMRQLMKDDNIQRFIEWVANGDALKNGYIPLLHGVELRVSTKVPQGTAASSKKSQRAFVYIKGVAMGLGFTKEMEIETARYPEQRATTIIGSYELAAKNKAITAVCPIYTFYK